MSVNVDIRAIDGTIVEKSWLAITYPGDPTPQGAKSMVLLLTVIAPTLAPIDYNGLLWLNRNQRRQLLEEFREATDTPDWLVEPIAEIERLIHVADLDEDLFLVFVGD